MSTNEYPLTQSITREVLTGANIVNPELKLSGDVRMERARLCSPLYKEAFCPAPSPVPLSNLNASQRPLPEW